MCNCIAEIEQQLESQFGKGNFDLELSLWANLKTGKSETWLPPLFVKFHKRKPDGTPEKRVSKTHVKFTHCPFCGVAR